MATAFVYDPRYLEHDPGPGHPERPDRLRAILGHLKKGPLWPALEPIQPDPAERAWVERVHPPEYLARLEAFCQAGGGHLDPDTVAGPESLRVALLAAGGVIAACDAVLSGRVRNAFCAVRPPGHHAERARAMGFCLLNNVAIGARYLQHRWGLERMAIVDWDVHHGNGTQEIFYEDPSVLFISLHQHPLYPGTGSRQERGRGPGEGYTLNIPLPPGSDDAVYERAFLEEVLPALDRFRPEALLISAGFDAHRLDPLAQQRLSEAGFRRMAELLWDVARRYAGGRLIAVLEGGYHLEALARSVEACLEVWTWKET
ncbi:MAG: histone deacetylase [Bacteroidetes bacterium]|nr:histone deacetylase [Rhodothermia bacterium]MCX7907399.1 histone deacetylase [Bacteroidota bacterium]MDW8284670.1 histone deacetylase [Bacteroidota bacterium]